MVCGEAGDYILPKSGFFRWNFRLRSLNGGGPTQADDTRSTSVALSVGKLAIWVKSESMNQLQETLYLGVLLRAAEFARLLASALLSRGTCEMEKSSERASFRQIQFSE